MNQSNTKSNNVKIIKFLSWALSIGSAVILLKLLFMHDGYLSIYNKYSITKNFDPPIDYNFTSFLIFGILETLLCIVIFIASTFVLKLDEKWRNILIFSLGASIIVSFASPKLMYYPYLWSAILSLFLLAIIIFLSRKEIKVLFKKTT